MEEDQDRHAAVRAVELVCGYANVAVCGPVGLKVWPGQTLGIVGANAAGKSTLLRTLIGGQPALEGDVTVRGLPPVDGSVLMRRMISSVIDEDAFLPSLTVEEHLRLVTLGHGVDDVDGAVEAELKFFNLRSAADRIPGHLSSGQRRRLLLAAAFVRPFGLLALDEPEQRLDAGMRQRLMERLRRLHNEPDRAVVLVTHDPDLLRGAGSSPV